jgi:hypothetical protein
MLLTFSILFTFFLPTIYVFVSMIIETIQEKRKDE